MERPKTTGVGLMEQIENKYKHPAPSKESILNQIDSYPTLELIKDIKVDNDEVIDTEFYGDIMDDININERDQYQTLMNTFLNRRDKRKLKRYKGFKSFTDRIYGR